MKVIPFVHEGLGNSSYVVDIGGAKAVLVDPDRSIGRYRQVLDANGLTAAGVFETHLHADFVSGVNELLVATGAPVYLPAEAASGLPHRPLRGGDRLQIDGIEVEAVASPGHTPEHMSYVLRVPGAPPLLFSGGSLIVGGAARTDLISPEMTEPLTRAQFRTLKQAFSALPDETVLYPTHGGGSFCSTGAGGDRVSTLGRERKENPLLSFGDEGEFLQWFPSTFPAAPSYFFRLRAVNQRGPRLRRDIPMPPALSVEAFANRRASAVVVDTRSMEAYAAGHIPGAFNNTLRDAYAVWLGWLVPEDAELLFVVEEEGDVEQAVQESLLVGYERFAGWLRGGISEWRAAGGEIASTELVDAAGAKSRLVEGAAAVDVREPGEFDGGHIEGAINVPLGKLGEALGRIPTDRPLIVYCGHGERASTAISLLETAGRRDLINLHGGIGAWADEGYRLEG